MARNGSPRTLSRHLTKTVKRQLGILEKCHRWAKAKDPPEALHDLRVASRRLRAVGDVFETLIAPRTRDEAERRLRHVTRAAREVRDWDVARELLAARRDAAPTAAERTALRHLLQWAAMGRKRALAAQKKRALDIDLGDISDAVTTELEQVEARMPPREERETFARSVLDRLVGQVARELPPPGGRENPRALHRARVELKKVRYALELLSPILGADYAGLYEVAARVQELLGDHHDLVVLGDLVRRRALELATEDHEAMIPALSSLSREIANDRREVFRRFMASGFGLSNAAAHQPARGRRPRRAKASGGTEPKASGGAAERSPTNSAKASGGTEPKARGGAAERSPTNSAT